MSSGPAILLLLSKEDNDDSRGLQIAMLLEDLYYRFYHQINIPPMAKLLSKTDKLREPFSKKI